MRAAHQHLPPAGLGVGYNSGMSERDDKRGGSGLAIVLVLGLLLLPALYVLGIGPAALCAKVYPGTSDFLETMYMPVIYPAEKVEPLGQALDWYIDLWE